MNMGLSISDIIGIIGILILAIGLARTIDSGIHPERYEKQTK